MLKIFKHLAGHLTACLAVVALLLVQAYCDLSLPDYTSRIVDTGIQLGGIESAVPDSVRASTLDALVALMDPADAEAVRASYTQPDAGGVQQYTAGSQSREALEDAFSRADTILYLASAAQAGSRQGVQSAAPEPADLDAVTAAVAAMGATDFQIPAAMEEAVSAAQGQAALLVRLEYQAMGIADQVQTAYLLRVGGQMLALTLLMVVVAVLVGLIASRVSAAIGRDLRQGVFRSVVGYSNAEIDRFSTASLITRTTNDIQQVQFVCVILLRVVAYAPILGIGGILHVIRLRNGPSWVIVVAVAALLGVVIALMQAAMPKFRLMQTLVDRLNLVSGIRSPASCPSVPSPGRNSRKPALTRPTPT